MAVAMLSSLVFWLVSGSVMAESARFLADSPTHLGVYFSSANFFAAALASASAFVGSY